MGFKFSRFQGINFFWFQLKVSGFLGINIKKFKFQGYETASFLIFLGF
jgi:hypothetical protein